MTITLGPGKKEYIFFTWAQSNCHSLLLFWSTSSNSKLHNCMRVRAATKLHIMCQGIWQGRVRLSPFLPVGAAAACTCQIPRAAPIQMVCGVYCQNGDGRTAESVRIDGHGRRGLSEVGRSNWIQVSLSQNASNCLLARRLTQHNQERVKHSFFNIIQLELPR